MGTARQAGWLAVQRRLSTAPGYGWTGLNDTALCS